MLVSSPILKQLESTVEMGHIDTESINKQRTSYMVARDDKINAAVEHIKTQGNLQRKATLKVIDLIIVSITCNRSLKI